MSEEELKKLLAADLEGEESLDITDVDHEDEEDDGGKKKHHQEKGKGKEGGGGGGKPSQEKAKVNKKVLDLKAWLKYLSFSLFPPPCSRSIPLLFIFSIFFAFLSV